MLSKDEEIKALDAFCARVTKGMPDGTQPQDYTYFGEIVKSRAAIAENIRNDFPALDNVFERPEELQRAAQTIADLRHELCEAKKYDIRKLKEQETHFREVIDSTKAKLQAVENVLNA